MVRVLKGSQRWLIPVEKRGFKERPDGEGTESILLIVVFL